MYILKHKI